jgi:hypothetical protein
MHIIYGHKHDLKMDDTPRIISTESLMSRTTTAAIDSSPTTNQADENYQSISSAEITPLIIRSEENVDSGKTKLFFKENLIYLIIF